ncbi:hypothetical protein [Actinoplanes sp. NPDC049802]|uniref:hypothetical protein n=1 Tax=Actinoplanes sp. NPDC049802 TaxID=3154742 RepID=UPI0033CA00D6
MFDQNLPVPLALALAAVDYRRHDFQPFVEFDSAEETTEWWRLWTDNEDAEVPPLRFFGKNGSGDHVAIWLRDPDVGVEAQPVVLLGSEGEQSVIARNLGDYLCLLANGVGPLGGSEPVGEPVGEIIALISGKPRPTGAIRADAEMLQLDLEKFVDEVSWGPFDDDGEPAR